MITPVCFFCSDRSNIWLLVFKQPQKLEKITFNQKRGNIWNMRTPKNNLETTEQSVCACSFFHQRWVCHPHAAFPVKHILCWGKETSGCYSSVTGQSYLPAMFPIMHMRCYIVQRKRLQQYQPFTLQELNKSLNYCHREHTRRRGMWRFPLSWVMRNMTAEILSWI